MSATVQQGSSPRRGVALVLAGLVTVGVIATAAVVGTPGRAEASGLAAFASCAELEAWGADALGAVGAGDASFEEVGGVATTMTADLDDAAAGAPASAATESAESASAADGAARSQAEGDTTNVVVEGVDELDVIDRLSGDRYLIASAGALAIVDLAAGEVLARQQVGWDAQITYDADAAVAWVVGHRDDGLGVRVVRVGVGASELDRQGEWTAPGMLVDARRVGGELHVVASDGFGPMALGGATEDRAGGLALPFGGEAVPCDQVLHPVATSDPTASLIATLPATGEVAPVRTAQVVGSGQLVHVTTGAAYLATPQWAGAEPTTTIHRFDLASLTHTGSGTVGGTLLNDFSMSEHDGHLRVAITRGGGGMVIGRPMPADGGVIIVDDAAGSEGFADEAVAAEVDAVGVGRAPASTSIPTTSVPEPDPTEPDPTEPEPTEPDPTIPEPTVPETTVPETTVPGPEPEPLPEPEPMPLPEPEPIDTDPRNRIVVLDIDGDLDVVGETGWFGKPGESIFGIRFVGATAYAVTFLQTDPFYVVDLADPTAPAVVGEVELPGFSAYLHPLGDGLVVGFGPDETGRASAKLFDVSDPTAPRLADSVLLGDESPVVYDHHAFVSLGEIRFAVPVTTWSAGPMGDIDCAVPLPGPVAEGEDEQIDPGVVAPCEPIEYRVRSEAVELEVADGRLREVARAGDDLPDMASRVIPTADGWALVAGLDISILDGSGQRRALVELG